MFLVAMVLTPVVDQGIKYAVRTRLGRRSVAIGVFGELRMVSSEMWTLRLRPQLSLSRMWLLWFVGAAAAVGIAAMLPASAWAMGLLVGGAFSHAIETSVRGSICDYVCLRFWPAFNAADLAITVGALGLAGSALRLI